MEHKHMIHTKIKWKPWLNEAERLLAEEGEPMRALQIYERTKDKLYWSKVPKNVNAAAQILGRDQRKRFYQTEKDKKGHYLYGLREWQE